MKVRQKSPEKQKLIRDLYGKGIEQKMPLWKAVAKGLNRPRRNSFSVNLFDIEKHAKPHETIIVPGSVLGTGNITKSINIAAFKFTKSAEEKIKKAGGKILDIETLSTEHKKGKVRIMG